MPPLLGSYTFLHLRFYFSLLRPSTRGVGETTKQRKWSRKATQDSPPPSLSLSSTAFPGDTPVPPATPTEQTAVTRWGRQHRGGRQNSKQSVVKLLGTRAKDQTSWDFPKNSGDLWPESLPFLCLPLPSPFLSPLFLLQSPKDR